MNTIIDIKIGYSLGDGATVVLSMPLNRHSREFMRSFESDWVQAFTNPYDQRLSFEIPLQVAIKRGIVSDELIKISNI